MKYIKRVDESYSISEAFAELNRPVQSKKQKIKESFTDNISDAKIIKTFSEDFDKKLSVRELNEIPELPPHHNNINDFRMDSTASASLILRQFDDAVARTASNLLYIYGKAFKDEINAVLFPARGRSASQEVEDEVFAFWKRCWKICRNHVANNLIYNESKSRRRGKRVVEGTKDSWQTSEVFYDLFKSKDPKICSRAANILYDWYSAEDAFSDFNSKRAFLSFVKSDLADMFDAADSPEEVRAVIEALIGLRLKDFVIENLPEANKKITGYENPSATQIWDEADATLDDYSDYMIDKIIAISDCPNNVDYYIRSYIESIVDAELPD